MKAVADTSVLIALGAAGRLDLLHKMWDVIFIPRAVLEEVQPEMAGYAAVRDAMEQGWLKVVKTQASGLLPVWMGIGETECLALARQIASDVVLMDEIRGRKIILSHGFRVGSVGIVCKALEMGILDKSDLANILSVWSKINFRMGDNLIAFLKQSF